MAINTETGHTPLVTFAILAYNQREYILDAINGAISQDYSPLEIIISDDGSTDGTFELIKSFVDSYTGPHTVIANQTKANKCTVGHFFDVVDLASGRLLILAAGDDVSYPNRVRETVDFWDKEKAAGLFSDYDLIDERGSLLRRDFSPNLRSELAEEVFLKPGQPDIHGASSAYDLEFVKSLPRPVDRFFFEDTFMTFMLFLHEKTILKIDKPLVAYRTHAASISNSGFVRQSVKLVIEGQRRAARYTLNKYQLYLFMTGPQPPASAPTGGRSIDTNGLKRYMSRLEAKGRWIDNGIIGRLHDLLALRTDSGFVMWMLPRLFGLHVFALLRIVRGEKHATNN